MGIDAANLKRWRKIVAVYPVKTVTIGFSAIPGGQTLPISARIATARISAQLCGNTRVHYSCRIVPVAYQFPHHLQDFPLRVSAVRRFRSQDVAAGEIIRFIRGKL